MGIFKMLLSFLFVSFVVAGPGHHHHPDDNDHHHTHHPRIIINDADGKELDHHGLDEGHSLEYAVHPDWHSAYFGPEWTPERIERHGHGEGGAHPPHQIVGIEGLFKSLFGR